MSVGAPWKLATANLAQVRAANYEVAIVPFGATEPHNLHLPYGTDSLEAEIIGDHVCDAAWRRGARVALLPTLPFGTQTNQREFPLALNLYPSTVLAVTRDLVESLSYSGIRKIVLLNSHGGNDLKPILRELHGRYDARLFLCFWPQVVRDICSAVLEANDDHAGEMETSLALAYFPEFVARHPDGTLSADPGATRAFRFRALREGWVTVSRPWHLLTTNSGAGDPHAATAAKGKQIMAALVQRLADFLVELSQSPLDAVFPFEG